MEKEEYNDSFQQTVNFISSHFSVAKVYFKYIFMPRVNLFNLTEQNFTFREFIALQQIYGETLILISENGIQC